MNLRLLAAEAHIPARVRAAKVRELAALTARAFGTAPPTLAGRSFRKALEGYARFTREAAARAIEDKADLALLRGRLRSEALVFGRALAAGFRIRDPGQALRLVRVAYRAIGIDLRAAPDGSVLVSRCFFKEHYTPEACELVSSLDEGLMSGICGQGRLVFADRMTSGATGCRASFRIEETRT
jgi:hypothetical protein